MSALTFDTYEAIQTLMDKGVVREQAEGITQVIKQAQEAHLEELSTKKDLQLLEQRLFIRLGGLILGISGLIIAVAGLLIAYLELRG